MTTGIDWDHPTDPRDGSWQLEHVKQYVGSGGTEGQYWNGTQTLLLTTVGRISGHPVRTPLIYGEADGRYLLVASKGGADEHPLWFRNLSAHPEVRIQVGTRILQGTARTANAEERAAYWPVMVKHWPAYDEYQARTDREIPIVVIEPAA
ncbi:nitroreductase family deazaflavin-dependent oxidoreductase [Streptomyces yangpuensis]|uniref:Nitroreductase family deazaflavin-dependent oxidoreductase n=1 Tax=Streptomyces yangpuensis TaxID=1648182 RepID=A0ABY5PQE9_9ACTN|nr:nitroreductase family deazaflavin-dependent oxidoreductase [Streptomyces yangpuensis]MBZ9594269.1 nitroreductase family deazaflavin-dependent oxidoreductase [Streptomyces erythrochromogenes]UUY46371.1 nitroreductase family deazaflavin-dependent oxidoreductase [Streptomyces yangpuensis]